ncbi:MAG: hypothetical protein JJU18_03770 [Oceanicaulis sp.]|nr:hypothetical protein [Oceanicaulis sp.]
MTRADDEFDAALGALFDEAAPPAHDPAFTQAVMARVPGRERWRAGLLAAAALAGGALASLQAAPLISWLAVMLQDAGALAAGAVGGQALAMAVAGAGALGLALILSWRELDLR